MERLSPQIYVALKKKIVLLAHLLASSQEMSV